MSLMTSFQPPLALQMKSFSTLHHRHHNQEHQRILKPHSIGSQFQVAVSDSQRERGTFGNQLQHSIGSLHPGRAPLLGDNLFAQPMTRLLFESQFIFVPGRNCSCPPRRWRIACEQLATRLRSGVMRKPIGGPCSRLIDKG